MTRFWILPAGRDSRLLTGPQLAAQNIHPLRCHYLGRFTSEAEAMAAAAAIALKLRPELVTARNVRTACDRRQTRRWRLSDQEIDLLRRGQELTIRDGLGSFVVGYIE